MSQTTVNPPTRRAEPDTSEWTPSLAECVARVYGIDPLSERHWRVISECREEWARSGVVPEPERLALISHLSVEALESLFPVGHPELAWIFAGVVPPASLSSAVAGRLVNEASAPADKAVFPSAAPKPRGSS